MNPVKLARLALVALFVSPPQTTLAQDFLPAGEVVHERIFEVQPFGGWFMPDDNAGYDSGSPLLGVRGTLNNSSRWAFEAQAGLAVAQTQFAPRGVVESYVPHPVFNNAGFPIGVVITELETTETVREYAASLLMMSGSAMVHLSMQRLRPFITLGGGFIDDITNSGGPPGPFSDLFLQAGIGLKYLRPAGWGLRLELTDVFLRKDDLQRDAPDAAVIAAQVDALTLGGSDGVLFKEPYVPVVYRGDRWLHNLGLSLSVAVPFGWAWKDGDGDGVETRFDRCPTTAPKVIVDATGCGTDADQDSVFDGVDSCPDTPRGATVDRNGCPSDTDRDGVLDGIDVANDTPAGALVDATGAHRDTDKDGVPDGPDKCEDTPRGAAVDTRGCPVDAVEEALLRGRPVAVAAEFEGDTSELDPRSYRSINRVARLVERWTSNKERPIRIEVGVHGAAGESSELSQARAEAVRTYLLDNFFDISDNNLTAKGYAPTADATGRRVELLYIGEGEAPIDLLSDEPADVGQPPPPEGTPPAPSDAPVMPAPETPAPGEGEIPAPPTPELPAIPDPAPPDPEPEDPE